MIQKLSEYFSKQVYEIIVDYLFNTCEELRAKIDAEVRKSSSLCGAVTRTTGRWDMDDPNADAEFKILTEQLTLDGQEWKGR